LENVTIVRRSIGHLIDPSDGCRRSGSKSRACALAARTLREASMLQVVVGAVGIAAFTLVANAVGQEHAALLPLPQLSACRASSHPRLPEKWQATYLMAPFAKAQLVLSDIIYDGSLPAMRIKLYGVRRGAADLFVLGKTTYVLVSDGGAIKQCRNLGDTGWRPLPRDWLTSQSQCVGSAPVGDVSVDWWKTPVRPAPASYWIWSKTDQTPFRLVFQSASDRLAVFSRYALSYQVAFEPLSQTDLADIAAVCKLAKPAPTKSSARALRELIDGMAQSPDRADDEIKRLMPALDASCPATPLPTWPDKLALTGLLTPFDSDESPAPTEVLYDWSVPGQRSRIFRPAESRQAAQDALLLGPRGYNVVYRSRDGPICRPNLPGTIRPDWPLRGPCDCEAVINGTTPLTPHGTTQIMSCPLASPRAAWAWYSLAGRPTVFMVTSLRGDEGRGLFAVLDYWDWVPGYSVPRSAFDKPAQCLPSAGAPSHCATCHLGASH
jgi:hypothetical protein